MLNRLFPIDFSVHGQIESVYVRMCLAHLKVIGGDALFQLRQELFIVRADCG